MSHNRSLCKYLSGGQFEGKANARSAKLLFRVRHLLCQPNIFVALFVHKPYLCLLTQRPSSLFGAHHQNVATRCSWPPRVFASGSFGALLLILSPLATALGISGFTFQRLGTAIGCGRLAPKRHRPLLPQPHFNVDLHQSSSTPLMEYQALETFERAPAVSATHKGGERVRWSHDQRPWPNFGLCPIVRISRTQ